MRKRSILVVDDEFYLREFLVEVLESHGFKTVEAENGEECLRLNSKQKFDAILMDVRMPRMDGITSLFALRSAGNQTPVIIMSGYSTIKNTPELLEMGATSFIEKPFPPEHALKKLSEIL